LPAAHDRVFRWAAGELDASYAMLSVTLNDAIAVRQDGELRKAQLEVGFCAQLVERFAAPLAATIQALEAHARYYGTLPNTAPLNPAYFRFPRSQRTAWMQAMLCRVLFSERSQFFHKLHALKELVDCLASDFCKAAAELADGTSTNPVELWEAVDSYHYDLNTCLRETLVIMKSFLRVLPEDELGAFRKALEAPAQPRETVPRAPRAPVREARAIPVARR